MAKDSVALQLAHYVHLGLCQLGWTKALISKSYTQVSHSSELLLLRVYTDLLLGHQKKVLKKKKEKEKKIFYETKFFVPNLDL